MYLSFEQQKNLEEHSDNTFCLVGQVGNIKDAYILADGEMIVKVICSHGDSMSSNGQEKYEWLSLVCHFM